jgi:hypothetical protein
MNSIYFEYKNKYYCCFCGKEIKKEYDYIACDCNLAKKDIECKQDAFFAKIRLARLEKQILSQDDIDKIKLLADKQELIDQINEIDMKIELIDNKPIG